MVKNKNLVMHQIEMYNENGEVIDAFVIFTEYRNRIDYTMVELSKNCNIYIKHNEKEIYTKYNYNYNVMSILKKYGFNIEKYYIWNENKMKFENKNIVFYGGRGGEYAILENDEEYEILTSNGDYWKYNEEIGLIKNHGIWKIVGPIMFTDNATIHGIEKIRYNQTIVIYKKLNENIRKKYAIIKDKGIVMLVNKENEKIDIIESKYEENNDNYAIINFRYLSQYKFKMFTYENKQYIKIYFNDNKFVKLQMNLDEINDYVINAKTIICKYNNENKKVRVIYEL